MGFIWTESSPLGIKRPNMYPLFKNISNIPSDGFRSESSHALHTTMSVKQSKHIFFEDIHENRTKFFLRPIIATTFSPSRSNSSSTLLPCFTSCRSNIMLKSFLSTMCHRIVYHNKPCDHPITPRLCITYTILSSPIKRSFSAAWFASLEESWNWNNTICSSTTPDRIMFLMRFSRK